MHTVGKGLDRSGHLDLFVSPGRDAPMLQQPAFGNRAFARHPHLAKGSSFISASLNWSLAYLSARRERWKDGLRESVAANLLSASLVVELRNSSRQ